MSDAAETHKASRQHNVETICLFLARLDKMFPGTQLPNPTRISKVMSIGMSTAYAQWNKAKGVVEAEVKAGTLVVPDGPAPGTTVSEASTTSNKRAPKKPKNDVKGKGADADAGGDQAKTPKAKRGRPQKQASGAADENGHVNGDADEGGEAEEKPKKKIKAAPKVKKEDRAEGETEDADDMVM